MSEQAKKRRVEADNVAGMLEGLYQRPGFLVRRATQLSTSIFAELCPEITPRQYGALYILAQFSDLDQKQLAQLLYVDQTNIRIILEGLETRGFIRRTQSPEDGRRTLVHLTESGRLAQDSLEKKAQAAQKKLLKNLTEAEQKSLTRLLSKMLD